MANFSKTLSLFFLAAFALACQQKAEKIDNATILLLFLITQNSSTSSDACAGVGGVGQASSAPANDPSASSLQASSMASSPQPANVFASNATPEYSAAASQADPAAFSMVAFSGELQHGTVAGMHGPETRSYYNFLNSALVGDMLFTIPGREPERALPLDPEAGLQSSVQAAHGVTSTTSGRWADRKIPYMLHSSLGSTDRQQVCNAIRHWESKTNFDFITRSSENAYIVVQNGGEGSGCWSYIGRISLQPQALNVETVCGTGATIHEFGHAIGLYHEQNRADRDSYVNVNLANIQAAYQSQYSKTGASGIDLGSYDFNSIMHYGSYYFSTGAGPTMTKVSDGSTITPNRNELSSGDIAGVDNLYTNYP